MNRLFIILLGLVFSAAMSAQTVSGPSYLCAGSSNDFTYTGPWDPGSYWRTSANLSLSNSTSNPVSVTAANIAGTTVWIEAVPNSATAVSKYFSIGGPFIDINGPTSVDVGVPNYYYITVSSNYTGPSNLTNWEWVFTSSQGTLYAYGSWANLYLWTSGSYRIEARAQNSCGWGPWSFIYMDASRGSAAAAPYKVYPNPVKDILYIDIDSQSQANANRQQLTYDIRLFDGYGNLAFNRKTAAPSGTIQLDLSSLRNGSYMLQIFDGVDPLPYATIVIKQ